MKLQYPLPGSTLREELDSIDRHLTRIAAIRVYLEEWQKEVREEAIRATKLVAAGAKRCNENLGNDIVWAAELQARLQQLNAREKDLKFKRIELWTNYTMEASK